MAVTFLAWTTLGLLSGFQTYINTSGTATASLSQVLWLSLGRSWIYVALTPPVVWLTRRYPFSPGKWRRSVVVHLLAFAAFNVLYVTLRLVLWPPVDTATLQSLGRSVQTGIGLLRAGVVTQLWMYGIVVAVALTVEYYREIRRRELGEAELKARLAEYELQILKLQLHPHFLFNTLNGISTLMTQDVRAAREMMLRFSELLRLALAHTSAKTVTLREEIDFIETYLSIEQMRFGPRLQVKVCVDPDTYDARIPNMILQPLVENAVRHGIAAHRPGGTVEVTSQRRNSNLLITIRNDGPHALRLSDEPSGLGLGNTRARLLQLYGAAYNLRIAGRPQGGAEVTLEIPFSEKETEGSGDR